MQLVRNVQLPDGTATSKRVAIRFGLTIQYHPGDVARGGSSLDSSESASLRGPPLYDGNIAAIATRIGAGDTAAVYPGVTGEKYHYDHGRLAPKNEIGSVKRE